MKQTLHATAMVPIACFSLSQSNQEESLVQSEFGMEKKAMAAEVAELKGTQNDAFWMHYHEYESKLKELGRIEVPTKYVGSNNTLVDASTDGIIRDTTGLQGHNNKLIFTIVVKLRRDHV